jgi:hypothetical protein
VANLLLTRAADGKRKSLCALLSAQEDAAVPSISTESFVLSMMGALFGSCLSMVDRQVGVKLIPADIPRAHAIELNLSVLGFTLVLAILTGVVFGLAPALSAWCTDLNSTLQREGEIARLARTINDCSLL